MYMYCTAGIFRTLTLYQPMTHTVFLLKIRHPLLFGTPWRIGAKDLYIRQGDSQIFPIFVSISACFRHLVVRTWRRSSQFELSPDRPSLALALTLRIRVEHLGTKEQANCLVNMVTTQGGLYHERRHQYRMARETRHQ